MTMRSRETGRAGVHAPGAGPPQRLSAPLPPIRQRQLTIPPPGLDELEEGYAHRPEGAFAPEQAIDEQIASLEAWAMSNLNSEARELSRFWLFRGLAFLGAVAAASPMLPWPTSIAGAGVAALAVRSTRRGLRPPTATPPPRDPRPPSFSTLAEMGQSPAGLRIRHPGASRTHLPFSTQPRPSARKSAGTSATPLPA
jgi:hypothetical protein